MITVKVDVRKALAGIDALQTRQVPFALALAWGLATLKRPAPAAQPLVAVTH